MKILVLGAGGAIGNRRINCLKELEKNKGYEFLIYGCDLNFPVEKRRNDIGWIEIVEGIDKLDFDFVIIATPHDVAEKYLYKFSKTNKYVLIEKPFCRSVQQSEVISSFVEKYENKIFVGFNYRFLPGVQQLVKDIQDNYFGEIISVNAVLAHGGSPKDAQSWKLDWGGTLGWGSLLDPGIHMLDLLYHIFGKEIFPSFGQSWYGFWNKDILEEVSVMMQYKKTLIDLQTSLVKWRNTFKIEINGTEGYGVIDGRDSNYGMQTYRRGKRWGWQSGKSQAESEEKFEYLDVKDSFYLELENIFDYIYNDKELIACTSWQALDTMRIYNDCLEVIE